MNIIISNSKDEPIYSQIVNQLKNLILQGELKPGQMLPSIRLLAKELQISVITTKRAYDELENDGFLESVPGKGSFVAGGNKELIRETQYRLVEEKLNQAIMTAKAVNLPLEELEKMLRILFEEN